ncbi:PilZ domain-containing protein [Candidatus Albibeggiatoa sp. nov. BB20]|uniref:PilZ domain-containing protein n=1 Tax=Candidatus Albibeggiatoa sp. nov. BB20 TaxID=3162723 RepID=UPI00336543F5
MKDEGRRFIRHPAQIPIRVASVDDIEESVQQTQNVSLGGLAFESEQKIPLNELIEISIMVDPQITLLGRVAWCRLRGEDEEGGFEVGVEFIETSMGKKEYVVDEMCLVERYQRMLDAIAEDLANPISNLML